MLAARVESLTAVDGAKRRLTARRETAKRSLALHPPLQVENPTKKALTKQSD